MIFEPLSIGTLAAKNRLLRAATAESLAPTGAPGPELVDLYGRLAEGQVGTIITGYAYVAADGKPSEGALSLADDSGADGYRALTDAVHERGARIVAQLVYGGSKSKLADGDERLRDPGAGLLRESRHRVAGTGEGAMRPNVDILGPSPIENPATGLVPVEANASDLHRLEDSFAQAATRACSYGFDGVEVHAAHGYLLGQFLSPLYNKRTDAYGGSLENRARLACECVGAVRSALPDGFPVFVKLNSSDSRSGGGGLTEFESIEAARMLEDAGASAIEVTGDWHSFAAGEVDGSGFFADHGAELASKLSVPVVVTGGWRDPGRIDRYLCETGVAAIGMSRPLICEPGLPARWRSGDANPSLCLSCNSCCKRPGIPCARNRA